MSLPFLSTFHPATPVCLQVIPWRHVQASLLASFKSPNQQTVMVNCCEPSERPFQHSKMARTPNLPKVCPGDCFSGALELAKMFVQICPKTIVFFLTNFWTKSSPPHWNAQKQSPGQLLEISGVIWPFLNAGRVFQRVRNSPDLASRTGAQGRVERGF